MLMPMNIDEKAVIIERKHTKEEDYLIDACEEAIQQIKEKGCMKKKSLLNIWKSDRIWNIGL